MGIYGNPWESMGIPGIRPSPGVGNSPPLLAVRTKFDQYYSTVLQYRTAQPLQRRARRHATINVVDFNDVTRCQNMVDVSDVTTCQNKHARVFCVCDVTE